MYLKDGREIIESDQYTGYYIDQSNGAWCDENGNYVGGNADDGDIPGGGRIIDVPDIVFVSKSGKLYYPHPTAAAKTPMDIDKAHQKGYKPSRGYETFVTNIYKKAMKKTARKSKKK